MRCRLSAAVATVFGLLLAAVFLSGCGRSESVEKSKMHESDVGNTDTFSESSKSSQIASSVESGRKWISDIPYDVFFDDPISIFENKQQIPIQGPDTEVKTDPSSSLNSTLDSPKHAETDLTSTNWKEIIDKEILDSEVKNICNRLTKNLQTVGRFKSTHQEIPVDSATLATLAGIAVDHPDGVSWKQNAKYVRDLAGSMANKELIRDKKSYDVVKTPFEKIVGLLDGSVPGELPDSADVADFADVAEMNTLMKRLDRAERWMQANVRSEDGFNLNGETVIHEANIIAALAKVTTTEGYGYSEDENFLGYAVPLIEACRKMIMAVEEQNYAAFDEGLNRMSQSCTGCHSEFRN